MNKLVNAIKNTPDALTDNGAETFSTTRSAIVDLFFLIGGASLNTVPFASIQTLFEEAYAEDAERAIRILLWLRDIRGGAGRREIFRKLMQYLETTRQSVAQYIIPYVSEFGRWDDILIFSTPTLRETAFATIAKGLVDPKVSGLAAKWMPRKGPVAAQLRAFLKLSPKQYRKLLVRLTDVVETAMCQKEWEDINYSHVPSLASIRYAKAFNKHDAERYQAWKGALERNDPEVKVNVGAVYPHDIVRSVANYGWGAPLGDPQLANEQWKRLPNYVGDASIMPIVDVSGSMTAVVQGNVRAMDISVSLGIYLAEKNRGPFKNLFMTFSASPTFVELTGNTLAANVQKTSHADWGGNTDLQASLRLLLNTAIKNKAKQEDMPEMILIISDMQFDYCVQGGTNFQNMERYFRDAGYKMPKVVFWNVNGNVGNNPVRYNQDGVALVSGFSPSLMESVLAAKRFDPLTIVDAVIMKDRYDIWA